ncbi:MAG: restriction endonuclease subunit S, partial [candidate division NC10 bacterium]
RKTNTIAFFKIENDGFGLGAQRREIDKNDLPAAADFLKSWLQSIPSASSTPSTLSTPNALIVDKAKIAANGDYNLSGERYREGGPQSTNYPWHKIESLVETVTPPVKIQKTSFGESGRFPIIDQSQEDIAGWTDDEAALIRPSKPLVIFGDHTCAVKLIETPFAQGADGIKILRTVDTLDPRFLYYLLRAKPLESSGYQRHFSKLKEHEIPLPPLEVQMEIVEEIEGYQKVINGARAVLDHYRPRIPIHPDWPMVAIEDLAADERNALKAGPFGSSLKKEFYVPSGFKIYGQEQVIRGDASYGSYYISEEKYRELESCRVRAGDVLISLVGTYGKTLVVPDNHEAGIINPRLLKLTLNPEKMLPTFFVAAFAQESVMSQVHGMSYGGTMDILSLKVLKNLCIPMPPLATQQAIVAEIEAEQALVAGNRELIARFERKIQATLACVWGEEEPASKGLIGFGKDIEKSLPDLTGSQVSA